MALPTDRLANISNKEDAQKDQENAVIGTLHCAEIFNQGIAQEEMLVLLCTRNLPPQHLRRTPRSSSPQDSSLRQNWNPRQRARLNRKARPKPRRRLEGEVMEVSQWVLWPPQRYPQQTLFACHCITILPILQIIVILHCHFQSMGETPLSAILRKGNLLFPCLVLD